MNKTYTWPISPWTNFCIALIALLVGVVGTYYAVTTKENKRLLYNVTATPIPTFDKSLKSNIQITVNGAIVNNAQVVNIHLKNRGNIQIEKGDFETPITFLFKTGKILTAQLIYSKPESLKPSVKYSENSITILPLLLNKGNEIAIQAIQDGPFTEPEVNYFIAGVDNLEKETSQKSGLSFNYIILSALSGMTFAFLAPFLLYFLSKWNAKVIMMYNSDQNLQMTTEILSDIKQLNDSIDESTRLRQEYQDVLEEKFAAFSELVEIESLVQRTLVLDLNDENNKQIHERAKEEYLEQLKEYERINLEVSNKEYACRQYTEKGLDDSREES
jgi:hypothetical protein